MPSLPQARAELEALRASLVKPFKDAKARVDQAEMDRLTALAGEIDDALDDLAILGLAAVATQVSALKAKVEAAIKRAQSFPFGALGSSGSAPESSANAAIEPESLDKDRPGRSMFGETIADHLTIADIPQFVTLAEIKHNFVGDRPKGLEGAIVHYDAGRSRPTKGADDLEWGAKNTLAWGQTQGFCYATISRSGMIYLPGNMDWKKWGSHAGQSKCPTTGRTAVSQFYVGFEINSPGLVYPTPDADAYVPWFDAVRDQHGNVVLNSKGQATIANKNGQIYKKAELRIIASQTGNIRPGAYVPYTDQQYNSLIAVLLFLKRQHKDTFRLDFVFGHDEVSPGRKVDPGGSLGRPKQNSPGPATTMTELRTALLKQWADHQALG